MTIGKETTRRGARADAIQLQTLTYLHYVFRRLSDSLVVNDGNRPGQHLCFVFSQRIATTETKRKAKVEHTGRFTFLVVENSSRLLSFSTEREWGNLEFVFLVPNMESNNGLSVTNIDLPLYLF